MGSSVPSAAALDDPVTDVAARIAGPKPRPLTIPQGDFSELPPLPGIKTAPTRGDARTFDPTKATLVERTESSDVYRNPDGTRTAVVYSTQVNFKTSDGRMVPIETSLVADGPERVRNIAGPVQIELPAATASGHKASISRDGWTIAFELEGSLGGRAGQVDGSAIRYQSVLDGVDLQYRAAPTALKEAIVLTRPPAEALTFRFPLDLQGVEPRAGKGGQIGFFDPAGKQVAVIPPGFMTDSSAPAAADAAWAPVAITLTGGSGAWALEVRPDQAWLTRPGLKYPVSIDPTIDAGYDTQSEDAYTSSATSSGTYNNAAQWENPFFVNRIGFSSHPSTEHWTYLKYDLGSIQNKYVVSAQLRFWTLSKAGSGDFRLYRLIENWEDYSVTHSPIVQRSTNPEDQIAVPNPAVNNWTYVDMTDWAHEWVRAGGWANYGVVMDTATVDTYVRMVASEQKFEQTGANLIPAMFITYTTPPPAPTSLLPWDGDVVTTETPTLGSAPVTDPDGETVRYDIRLYDPVGGQVVDSGLLATPSWTVPAGVLQNGLSYQWLVIALDDGGAVVPSAVQSFRVNLRLGADPAAPTDSLGPATVNLATGNVSVGHGSPSFASLGGPLGVSFSYNSKAPATYGLDGSYIANCNTTPTKLDTQLPLMRRHDPAVSFDWTTGSPIGSIPADNFCVRWVGEITVPYFGTNWTLGAASDDGARIWVNGQQVMNEWTNHGYELRWGSPITLQANQRATIEVEYYEAGGAAAVQLWIQGPVGPFPVPTNWLSTYPPALPQGWSPSFETAMGLSYVSATVSANGVALVRPDGDISEFGGDSFGNGFVPLGDDRSVVTRQAANGWIVVQGDDGVTYTFDGEGRLQSAIFSPDESTTPTAAVFNWTGPSGRLSSITDPVTNRSISFRYSGDPFGGGPQCPTAPGFDANAPTGHLCLITYWDGAETKLYYAGTQLARIEDPGGETTDFAYEFPSAAPLGRLVSVRSPLAKDLAGSRGEGNDVRTQFAYDAAGRVISVTAPAPTAGAARPAHTYNYDPPNALVHVVGLVEPNGFARAVSWDGSGRLTSDLDATYHATWFTWDSADRLVRTNVSTNGDPDTGLMTSTIYDSQGRVAETYGPAPASTFGSDHRSPGAPRSQRTYDGAATFPDGTSTGAVFLKGLAATYWNGADPVGPPASRATGVGDPTGALNRNWGTTSPPGVGDAFWAEFSGTIDLPSAGTWTFHFDVDDGVRLFIDDVQVLDRWDWCCGLTANGQVNNAAAGKHRIRVEYVDLGGPAHLTMYWGPPTGSTAMVPGTALSPNYGLVTSTKEPDGKRTNTEYARPETGLATATVVDPGGLNVRTETEYNDLFLRRTARRLPEATDAGDPATETYSYYGATEGPIANVCGASGPQAGFLKQSTSAAPASIVRQYVYDARGRQVGSRVAGPVSDANWSCVTYDARGRVTSVTNKSGSGSTFNFSVPDQVTESFADSAGAPRTTVAKVDLLGRPIEYTDEQGTRTRAVYDQPGRLTATYRMFAGQGETQLTQGGYDAAGRLTTLTEHASGAPRAVTFTYDNAGRLATTTRPGNVVTTNVYSTDRGRLTEIQHKKGAAWVTGGPLGYAYTNAGRVSSESGSFGSRSYTYDGAGRLTQTAEGGTTRRYAYDRNSNRCATAATCDGSYTYDASDRISASPYASAYSYDAHGNLTDTTPRAGFSAQHMVYDANDHATEINDGVTKVNETLAPSGRVLRRVVTQMSTGSVTEDVTFGYDGPGDSPAYQRSGVAMSDAFTGTNGAPWDATKWNVSAPSGATVDIQGNEGRLYVTSANARASAIMAPVADAEALMSYRFSDRNSTSELKVSLRTTGNNLPASVDTAYRVIVASNSSTIKLRQTINGSTTTIAQYTYTKTTAEQWLRFKVQGSSIKVKTWADGTTEPAAWNIDITDTGIAAPGILHVSHDFVSGSRSIYVDDVTLSTNLTKTFIGGPGGLLVTDTDGVPAYALGSSHGDIVGTTDASGVFTAVPITDEFGKGQTPQSRLGWLGGQERFTAHPGAGIIRMGVRLYDPAVGRFVQVDSIEGGCSNDYAYVNDPVNQFDLDGRKACSNVRPSDFEGVGEEGIFGGVGSRRSLRVDFNFTVLRRWRRVHMFSDVAIYDERTGKRLGHKPEDGSDAFQNHGNFSDKNLTYRGGKSKLYIGQEVRITFRYYAYNTANFLFHTGSIFGYTSVVCTIT